jgi:menaquinone-9 beta-reductase
MRYDVIIVGGGPGGSSSAITLAKAGLDVLVLEAKQMPRDKLCGEFVAPECFPTLNRLGVMDKIIAMGPQKITTLSLTASNGRQIGATIDAVSHQAPFAISLSRSVFDQILFERAREAGALCLEGFRVNRALFEGGIPCAVEATSPGDGLAHRFQARVIIDASGRNSHLTVGRDERIGGRRGSRLYAFKAHLRGVEAIREQVELYFFGQGYGGLSRVENEMVNLCFLANEGTIREGGGDPTQILRRTVMQNPLARERLARAEVVSKWYSSGPLTFGRRRLTRDGVIVVGDASGMIDPFTGTGIQIALRTGEMAAEAVIASLADEISEPRSPSASRISPGAESNGSAFPVRDADRQIVDRALGLYGRLYQKEFGRRLTASGLLRSVAFSPSVANGLAGMLSRAPWLVKRMLRATRSG